MSYSITQDSHKEEVTLDETYSTEEAAKAALNKFIETYNGTGKVVKNRNEDLDTTSTIIGDTEYSTYEEAIAVANALETDNEDKTVTTNVREETKTVTGPTEAIESIQFDTELEALNYIEQLKNKGYFVEDLVTELVSFEESTWVNQEGVIVDPGTSDGTVFNYGHFDVTLLNNFTKIEADGTENNVTGTVKVSSVSINGNTVNMSGPSTDPNTGLREYTSTQRNNLGVTNRSLVEITGTVTFDGKTLPFTIKGYLSESQNVCGGKGRSKGYDLEFKSITIINETVLVDTNIVHKYKVTGNAYKIIDKDVYYVDQTILNKGYDFQAIGTGEKEVLDDSHTLQGTKSKDIMKDEYALDVTTETKLYEYYPETVEKNLYYLTVKADIPKKEKKAKKSKSKAITNPQTGDNILVYAILLTMSAGALTAESICLRKEM